MFRRYELYVYVCEKFVKSLWFCILKRDYLYLNLVNL